MEETSKKKTRRMMVLACVTERRMIGDSAGERAYEVKSG